MSPRSAPPRACPAALLPLLPRVTSSWLFTRPRAIFDHPRLGPILARSFDDATERALLRRAERTGYDLRTLDRAAIAWTLRGTVYLVSGPLDGGRIGSLLWERLLSPRARANDAQHNVRMEGTLAQTFVSLVIAPVCGQAAYAEGDTGAVDRLLGDSAGRSDPESLLVWHASRVPDELAANSDAALSRQVREIEVRAQASENALVIELDLLGTFGADAPGRIRRALQAFSDSPLGDLSGAVQWLHADRLDVRETTTGLTASVAIPWRALAALGDALRGQVDGEGIR